MKRFFEEIAIIIICILTAFCLLALIFLTTCLILWDFSLIAKYDHIFTRFFIIVGLCYYLSLRISNK